VTTALTGTTFHATTDGMGKLGGVGVAALVAAGAFLLTACPSGPMRPNVGGRITKSPGCGVVLPDEPVCPDLPVAGLAVQFKQADGTVAASDETDRNGRYELTVPAGSYTLVVDTGTETWPHCEPTPVEVKPNQRNVFDVTCGSGIR
jgi:hypothetical protein